MGRRVRGLLHLVVLVVLLLLLPLFGPHPGAAGSSDVSPALASAGAYVSPGTIRTVAGSQPFEPAGSVVYAGYLYVSTGRGHTVVRIDPTDGDVEVVAGNGTSGYSGDGGPAAAATLDSPSAVAVDGPGNLFIADTGNQRVRRVDAATGAISTVAGNGLEGYSADGGPATEAKLNDPSGVAVDSAGNVFVADSDSDKVRRVDAATGLITTVAGTTSPGFSGDGGPATDAQLRYPEGITLDGSGHLLIADTGNNRVRRVDAQTGVITTVAGPVSGMKPVTVAVDGGGTLFLADRNQHRVVGVGATGAITVPAGIGTPGFSGDDGPATEAALSDPAGVAVDTSGNLFVSDRHNRRVRRVDAGTAVITTLVGTGVEGFAGDGGSATDAQLEYPTGVAANAGGDLFIADWGNDRVRRVDAETGVITTVAGTGLPGFSGDGGPAAAAQVDGPGDLATDEAGNLFIADADNRRVRRVDAETGVITTVAGTGDLGFAGDGGPAVEARLRTAGGLALDLSGNLYIADSGSQRVRRVDAGTGIITTVAGTGTRGFAGDGGPATEAQLNSPCGVAVAPSGDLYIADGSDRVRRVEADTGIITTVAGTGPRGFGGDGGPATEATFSSLSGVAVNDAGDLFLADTENHRVRRVDGATGVITTAAGTGPAWVGRPVNGGYSGDGGPSAAARLNRPGSVAVDGAGNVLVADRSNHRVREVAFADGAAFHPVTPFRVLDSRPGPENVGFVGPVAGGASMGVPVAGVGSVPASATAVVLNVTATEGTDASYLAIHPSGEAPPSAANIVFAPGETVPNQVTAAVGPDGKVEVFNQAGNVHVVADVAGYFDDGPGPGDLFVAVPPTRLLDSRQTGTAPWSGAPLGPGEVRDLTVGGQAGVPATATAVVMNVAVTEATQSSYLQAFPAGAAQPVTANLVFTAGQTVPNLVTVGLAGNGGLSLFNQAGSVHVVADVVGYYDPTPGGSRFHPLTPTRLLDSRQVGVAPWTGSPLSAGTQRSLTVAGGTAIPAGATALVANLTATDGTSATYLSVSPVPGVAPAPTANLLPARGQTVANALAVGLGAAGALDIFNQLGDVHVVIDAAGYYAPT